MKHEEEQYLDVLRELISADKKEDRTGVGTRSIFGTMMKFSLEDGTLPLLTTKNTFFRGIVEELLFFIRGERNSKLLEEKGVNIWKGNTTREFLDKRGLKDYSEGDIGPMYGAQWRDFGGTLSSYNGCCDMYADGVDQLQNAFDLIKNDPNSRRIIVTAYNPQEAHLGVLEPCHMSFQFNVRDGFLDCMFLMRSIDTFLGLPFNVASYGVLTHIMAAATGLKPGVLTFVGGDTHLYQNHMEQAKTQLERIPYTFPRLKINKDISSVKDMEDLEFNDFELIGYEHHPAIKAPMAV